MKICCLGHSGFLVQWSDYVLVIDCVLDNTNRLSEELNEAKKVYVMSTHGHHDHFSMQIFDLYKRYGNVVYILSTDIEEIVNNKQSECKIKYMNKGESYIDEETGFEVKAYGSTDIGISLLMNIDGKKVFHAGDLNNWHWEC